MSILTFALHPQGELQPADAPCPLYLLPLQKTYDLFAARGALALRRLLKQERVAIVQTFFESSDLWAGGLVRLLSSARVIWSRRDMGILRGKKHTLAYRLLRRVPHAVCAVSEQVRQHAVTVDGIAPERVHTIYNGLAIASGHPLPRKTLGSTPTIATIGNIRFVKGHDLLIHAAAAVVKAIPHATFLVAGECLEPEYCAELHRLVRELDLTENFRFVGKISDMSAYLRQADLFVLPSRSEGFSNALIEAMANGLPMVATDVGGNAEAVQDGVSGFIVPPGSAPALAEAILRLLSSPEAASEMGRSARERVERCFTEDAMLQKTVNLYRVLLRGE